MKFKSLGLPLNYKQYKMYATLVHVIVKMLDTCGRHFEHMRQEGNRTRDLFTLFVAFLINKVHMHLWDALCVQTTLISH
jgi:hypothetical protein